jgi:hypothetical protein
MFREIHNGSLNIEKKGHEEQLKELKYCARTKDQTSVNKNIKFPIKRVYHLNRGQV